MNRRGREWPAPAPRVASACAAGCERRGGWATLGGALWQAGGATALFIAGFGAAGYGTRQDLSGIAACACGRSSR